MEEFEDELDPQEVEALRNLAREKTLPDFLEQKVVQALRESQLVRSPWAARRALLWKLSVTAAAAAVLLTAGFGLGARWKSRLAAIPTRGPEFVLLLRNSPREAPIRSTADELNRVREYSAWARNLSREGKVLDGEKLTDDARNLNLIEGQSVISIADSEAKKTAIAGFFLIRARDYQEAIGIAESCPHAKYGGTIEIRQIDPVAQKSN